MKFQDKLKKYTREQLWSEYCGFLDLGLTDYMYIQSRLMEEQLKNLAGLRARQRTAAWEISADGGRIPENAAAYDICGLRGYSAVPARLDAARPADGVD